MHNSSSLMNTPPHSTRRTIGAIADILPNVYPMPHTAEASLECYPNEPNE
jgi:hypothetical protein